MSHYSFPYEETGRTEVAQPKDSDLGNERDLPIFPLHFYRQLFELSQEAVLLLRIVRDNDGKIEDFIVHEVNRQWETSFAMKRDDIFNARLSRLSLFTGRDELSIAIKKGLENEVDLTDDIFSPSLNKYFSGRLIPLEHDYCAVELMDITAGKTQEEAIVQEAKVKSVLRLLSKALTARELEIGRISGIVLDCAQSITKSELAYVSYIDPETGDTIGYTNSPVSARSYAIVGSDSRFLFPQTADGKYPGIWGQSLNAREPFFTNDVPRNLPDAALPSGIKNFLSAPAVLGNELVGQIALANAVAGYGESDLDAVVRLQELFCFALQRWRIEYTLRENEEKYRSIFENASNLIIILNTRGSIIECNANSGLLLDYDCRELTGKSIETLYHPSQLERNKAHFHDLVEQGIPKTWECKLGKKIGTYIDVIINASGRKNERGKITRVAFIVQDISEQKQTEEALKVSEEKFRSISEQSFMGIALLQESALIYANEAFSALFEIDSRKPDPGRPRPEPLEFLIRQVEDARSGTPASFRNFAFRNRTPSGEEQWFEVYAKLIYYQDRNTHLLIIQDISKRVSAELNVRASLKEKEVLLKEIHHRVKNNLQIVSSLLNLQSQYISNKKLLHMFKESQNRIKAMALIHEKLYSSSRLSEIVFSDYITSLANTLYKTYHTDFSNVGLVIEAEDLALSIDHAVPCGIILNELVSNALKYAFPSSFKGEKKIIISLSEGKRGIITFSVRDTGIGLPKGVGLGKSHSLGFELVKILVEGQLEGRVKIKREGGTEFIITFNK